MRTPEVPIEGIGGVEELGLPEVKKPLTQRLAEAIERRTAESESGIAVVFNRHELSHVVCMANGEKMIAEWRTHTKDVLFKGTIVFSRNGDVIGSSANAQHLSVDSSKGKKIYWDVEEKIDPTVPYKIESEALGDNLDKYEVPLNTVVQIAENGHLIPSYN